MTNYTIWQMKPVHLMSNTARDIRCFGKMEDVALALTAGMYRAVAIVDAHDMEHAFEMLNLWNGGSLVRKLVDRMSSLSVGDVVQDARGFHVVAQFGFKKIGGLNEAMMKKMYPGDFVDYVEQHGVAENSL